jgi:hypothetical protein
MRSATESCASGSLRVTYTRTTGSSVSVPATRFRPAPTAWTVDSEVGAFARIASGGPPPAAMTTLVRSSRALATRFA